MCAKKSYVRENEWQGPSVIVQLWDGGGREMKCLSEMVAVPKRLKMVSAISPRARGQVFVRDMTVPLIYMI